MFSNTYVIKSNFKFEDGVAFKDCPTLGIEEKIISLFDSSFFVPEVVMILWSNLERILFKGIK